MKTFCKIACALSLARFCLGASLIAILASPSFGQSENGVMGGILPPDLQERLEKLPPEDVRQLAPIAARISILFAPDPVPDPSGLHSRLHRWESTVTLWASIDSNTGRAEQDTLAAELTSLQEFVKEHDGPNLEFVSNPNDAEFWILSGSLGDLLSESSAHRLADKFFGGNKAPATNFLTGIASNRCVHHLNVFGSGNKEPIGSIAQAVTIIRSDIALSDQIGCMRRGFAVAMGFVNDTTYFPDPSWAQRTIALIAPTDVDGEILRLLYSSRLRPDMDGLAAIHIMLDEEIAIFERQERKR